ncbi:MAG: hypothetical protein A3E87_09980 [Gammaproteobacteria bacterium RIFCSPHIGHO2_12_FULL_35_23]|nr:MAG: hypothetical protein A3E87_09980 [Gammaproteobacteria bacterium RIFCSPHIGHO2_12_FULL_35_23]
MPITTHISALVKTFVSDTTTRKTPSVNIETLLNLLEENDLSLDEKIFLLQQPLSGSTLALAIIHNIFMREHYHRLLNFLFELSVSRMAALLEIFRQNNNDFFYYLSMDDSLRTIGKVESERFFILLNAIARYAPEKLLCFFTELQNSTDYYSVEFYSFRNFLDKNGAAFLTLLRRLSDNNPSSILNFLSFKKEGCPILAWTLRESLFDKNKESFYELLISLTTTNPSAVLSLFNTASLLYDLPAPIIPKVLTLFTRLIRVYPKKIADLLLTQHTYQREISRYNAAWDEYDMEDYYQSNAQILIKQANNKDIESFLWLITLLEDNALLNLLSIRAGEDESIGTLIALGAAREDRSSVFQEYLHILASRSIFEFNLIPIITIANSFHKIALDKLIVHTSFATIIAYTNFLQTLERNFLYYNPTDYARNPNFIILQQLKKSIIELYTNKKSVAEFYKFIKANVFTTPIYSETTLTKKELVLAYIKSLSQEDKITALLQAIDNNTALGKYFWSRRGALAPNLQRGSLKLIVDELKNYCENPLLAADTYQKIADKLCSLAISVPPRREIIDKTVRKETSPAVELVSIKAPRCYSTLFGWVIEQDEEQERRELATYLASF